jgi:hypothetical protein
MTAFLENPAAPRRIVAWLGVTVGTTSVRASGYIKRVDDAIPTESDDGDLILTDPTPAATRAFYRIQHDSVP